MKPFPTKRQFLYILLILIAVRVLYYWRSDGFSVERIENTFPKTEYELVVPTSRELSQLKSICEKPFDYLGKGSQAYAFESYDRKFVLKLFKCYHLKPIPWLEALPLPGFLDTYRNAQLERRAKKCNATLKSYRIAYTLLKDECGLLFLQIYPSSSFHQNVTFTDKIGRTHTIDLANYGFLMQKKAALVFPSLKKWIQENELDKAKEFLKSLVQLIISRSKKGVQDQDPDLHKNAGVIGTTACCIDVGGFHMNEEAKSARVYIGDIKKITRKLSNWLEEHSPPLADFLKETIKQQEAKQAERVHSSENSLE